jgi:hypothetical protein
MTFTAYPFRFICKSDVRLCFFPQIVLEKIHWLRASSVLVHSRCTSDLGLLTARDSENFTGFPRIVFKPSNVHTKFELFQGPRLDLDCLWLSNANRSTVNTPLASLQSEFRRGPTDSLPNWLIIILPYE